MQALTGVPETAKAAQVTLHLRLNVDTAAGADTPSLKVGICNVSERNSYISSRNTCWVRIENYSRAVDVEARGSQYMSRFYVVGYIDDLGL